ncbi:ATP-binding protein [Rummeliibacillus stabekisii]|uniref:IstB-like ATP-binding domain-containing protein n=1 Tax=Rummeliibacillus stabekisii TaxID=241244 RepID=A0A143HCA6_9BACL|nr:ATP-binding protein [Rummeliibacillus stabekisii]AMW99332.1 hypothetical protein ATY39_07555 [Rummeliibacillus stabekisii]
MKPLANNLPKSILTALTSNECDKHGKPMPLMMIDGIEVCPKCELDKENARVVKSMEDEVLERERNKRKNTLYYRSVFSDQSIKDAGFKNYETRTDEERTNKELAIRAINHYKSGKIFTTLFRGEPGVGKSHLAMAIVRSLNEMLDVECAFINVRRMLIMIKGSFNDKDSPYTQLYFTNLLSRVDYLVLDDLGNESGDEEASKWVKEILTEVLESRQSKPTIVTTNYRREFLYKIYTKALVSRLLKNAAPITFEDTTDKRIQPFDLNQEVE